MADTTPPPNDDQRDDGVLEDDKMFRYEPLDYKTTEQRFLILHPCSGDKNDEEAKVRCSMETVPLADAKPFIAVRNSRGYRFLVDDIDIDGRQLTVPVAVERFLRHFRRDNEPVRLWLRHICLIEAKGEESVKYWNRPFLESMYERASEVVDMTIFNTDLLETGKIVPVVDGSYAEWQKEWDGDVASSTSPLPKAFPIRVGNMPSLEQPTDRYAYVPLDPVTREIRLILLNPSKDPSGRVSVHLAHEPIKTEVAYQAVSYTWGRERATTDIVVTGQLFAVSESLERFLRMIRSPTNPLILWIDAICIDQSNIHERDRQLPRMAAIYDTSVSVLASLGDMDGDAELASHFIPKLQSPLIQYKQDQQRWDVGEPGEFSAEEFTRHCLATYRFLTRPYFHRVWILQEIAWASNPSAICDTSRGFGFWQMDNAARNLQDFLESDPELAENMNKVAGASDKVHPDELDYIRKMFYFRHLMSGGRGVLGMSTFSPSAGLLETLILARNFQATDPRDKLFSLWNLATDMKGLDFNTTYEDSLPVSFTNCTRAWVLQHKSLDIVAAVERDPRSDEFYSRAPSWCPDWSVPASASSMVRKDFIPRTIMMAMENLNGPLYSADGGIKSDDFDGSVLSFEQDTLLCTGVIVDEVKGAIDFSVGEGNSPLGVFLQATEQWYSLEQEANPYKDYRQALWAMCVGDVPSTWPLRLEGDENFGDQRIHKRYKGNRDTARHFYRYVTDIGSTEAWQVMKHVLKGRVLGFTEKGYMCLLPRWVVTSDGKEGLLVLAVLAGCSTPVALRRLEDGSYKMVGSVFVQGWMEGEFIKEMMGMESPKTFWQSKMGEPKMRIR